ncbi:MAG: RluA family pseudouridine synthase [Lachnospiraceae bacterium]|nr:RluA family pseudouridine synthase [Lachnospiraceae bacterium]
MQAKIIYEDSQLIVCVKPAGMAVQTRRVGEMDLYSELMNHVAGKNEKNVPYIGIVHRLDQPVEGVMVFAKTREAAAALNRQLQEYGFGKYYYAVTKGMPEPKSGTMTDYLRKDGKTNTSLVVDEKTPGAKKAVLNYEVLGQREDKSLVRIQLKTGRHHQIRVQMAHAGCPLLGDRKYGTAGKGEPSLALCAYRLSFLHPTEGTPMEFEIVPEGAGFHGML